MTIQTTIAAIRTFLVGTFAAIDTWFEKSPALRAYKPEDGGWTIDGILEHIGLTNHSLLILIERATGKALQNAAGLDLQTELRHHAFQWEKLAEIGQHKRFAWARPEHLEPTGEQTLAAVRQLLKEQAGRCLHTLELLPNGEGVLSKSTMTANGLGKLNVYEYVYFLAQHGQRHLTQMQQNEAAFEAARQG